MREFTAADVARAVERLRAPLPGGKIEAALSFGVDLTLLAEQIRLTPAERAARMHTFCPVILATARNDEKNGSGSQLG